MTNNLCATCGKGEIEFQKVKDFETKIRGIPFTVPEAEIGICNKCGARLFSPQEIRRWQRLYDLEEERTGRLLSWDEIQDTRKGLALSIYSFARLIGTTRQSVYNWEREDRKAPQLRIVDLLLKLVRESASSGSVDVLHFLSEETGVEVSSKRSPERDAPRRRTARRWRQPVEYDRRFKCNSAPTALPSLRSF